MKRWQTEIILEFWEVRTKNIYCDGGESVLIIMYYVSLFVRETVSNGFSFVSKPTTPSKQFAKSNVLFFPFS